MMIFRRQTLIAGLWLLSLLCGQGSYVLGQKPTTESDLKKYEEALVLFREADAVPASVSEEKRRAAITKFLSAAEIFRSIGSRAEQGNSISEAARIHDDLSEDSEALRLHLQAADLLHEAGARRILATTLNDIGSIYLRAGVNKKALQYLEVARAINREVKNESAEALSLVMIGGAYDALGEKQKAIGALTESLVIRQRLGDKKGEIVALSNLSVVHRSLGENEKALGFLDQALKLARAIDYKHGEAVVLHNIATIYDDLGDSDIALDNYERALNIFRNLPDERIQGDTLNNLGLIYLARGERSRARESLYRALELRYKSDNLTGAIETLINIGFFHSEIGENAKALEFYNRALPMTRTQGNKSNEADILHNIGDVYDSTGDALKAVDFYNQALPLRRDVGDRAGEARTLSSLMAEWYVIKNGRLAVVHGKQAINRFQELRSAIGGLDAGIRKKYLNSIEDTYRILASILVEQGRLAEAEQVLSMLKEEEAFAFQRRDDKVARELLQKASLSEGEKTAIANYEKLAEQITELGQEYGELDRERLASTEGQFSKQARLEELGRLRADAATAFRKFLDQLRVEFAKSSKEKEVAQVSSSLQSTLREMKADRTAVVSTIAGERRLNIIVTTASVQRAHTVDISEEKLNNLIANFRGALTSPANGKPIDPRPAGQKLYDILVKPIEGDLAGMKADTIVWSLDGALRYLPTAAIWDKNKGYLAERFANSVVTLASRERLLLQPLKKNWTALGAGVSAANEGFSALDAVPDELDCIVTDSTLIKLSATPACTTGVIPGRKLLNEKFDESAFRSAMGRYSVLHIASHFKLVPGNENDSFLLLGGGDDRKFTVNDLRGLSMDGVELLALSACNTATPGEVKGNGVEIEGFGAVAQEVGARSVMATLWPVADSSTRDLMVEFYRRFGAGTETKAESLRRAQIQLMRGSYPDTQSLKPPRADRFGEPGTTVTGPPFETDKNAPYAHPYYWAPFILFGNWR